MKVINILTALFLAIVFSVATHQSVQPNDRIIAYIMIWGIAGVFLLRHLLVFEWLWNHIVIFFAILMGFVVINHTKKELKEWWNKD